MENSIYIGLSGQMALQSNMDIIANNVANMSTPGFRGQNLVFQEFLSRPQGALDPMSFVRDSGQYGITEPGPVQQTGSALNIALNGPGFIGVQGPGGKIAYTRGGNFQMDAQGILVTSAGFPVASNGGSSISIPAGSTEINIDNKGFVSNQDGQIGQIMIAEFKDPQSLKPMGNGLYQTEAQKTEPANTSVRQGYLEGSNVNPVIEMTRMIATLRAFQSVQQIMQAENDRLSTAIQRLTKQG